MEKGDGRRKEEEGGERKWKEETGSERRRQEVEGGTGSKTEKRLKKRQGQTKKKSDDS